MSEKEYQVNDYLSLKLEHNQTILYVGSERFLQCKMLLFHLPIKDLSYFEGIESIDDAEENYQRIYHETHQVGIGKITPEEEFWGHCSNLQVWHEHDYDTRLLHSNLGFPLLKKLAEMGDPRAKEMFISEIIDRYKNGNDYTREFLDTEGFLDLLPLDVRFHLELNDDDLMALYDLGQETAKEKNRHNTKNTLEDLYYSGWYLVENREIVGLKLNRQGLTKFPEAILDMRHLKELDLSVNKIEQIPRKIYRLKNLKKLILSRNILTCLPNSVCSMKNLEILWLNSNEIQCLPQYIGKLRKLKSLRLMNNRLKVIPDSICKLKTLEKLNINNNSLSNIPETLYKLKNLEFLGLGGNSLSSLPETFYKLKNLNYLNLENNSFKNTPNIIKKMDFVEKLILS